MTRVRLCLFSMLCLVGCYDLTFRPDDHTVTDFSVLAVHVDPPVLRPDAPLRASVLFADPSGDPTSVRGAWSVRLYDNGMGSHFVAEAIVSGMDEMGTGVYLPPPVFRLNDKQGTPSLMLMVYLCHGGFRAPARVGRVPESELLHTLCVEGAPATGVKFIDIPSSDAPQQNPRIERVYLNGTALRAVEDGGEAVDACGGRRVCGDIRLQLETYLDLESIDTYPNADIVLADGGPLPDGGVTPARYPERHRIDWYVTRGALATPGSTGFPTNFEEAAGPYRNTWRLSKKEAKGEAFFYVVVRDIRGGNDFRSFRVRFGGD